MHSTNIPNKKVTKSECKKFKRKSESNFKVIVLSFRFVYKIVFFVLTAAAAASCFVLPFY